MDKKDKTIKKTYIIPQATVEKVDATDLITASTPFVPNIKGTTEHWNF